MSQLEKAHLTPISSDESAKPLGDPIEVQFNPSSLRLQIANSTEGGDSRGKQVRQYTGSSSTTLTLDLVFDTADEGGTDSPRSVREKTAAVEQFVYPRGEGDQKQAPPKLRFQWGDLILEGVVDNITIDLDHFAPNGVPLRAKVGFSFKEQDRKYEFLASGPGANRKAGASLPGGISLGVAGGIGIGISAQASVGLAIGGESAAEFAARVGVDPEAWRGLSFDASAGGSLSLGAGAEVGFSAGLTAGAGLGVQVGAGAGASATLEASFGLEASAGAGTGISAGVQAGLQQGYTLAAAGGVGAAIEAVKSAGAAQAQQAARQAFAIPPAGGTAQPPVSTAPRVPPPSGAPKPALPEQPRTPLQRGPRGIVTPASGAPPAPPPPAADARATSFGAGVPLRPVVSDGAARRAGILAGSAPVRASVGASGVPVTSDPTTPPWVALPASSPGAAGGARFKKPCCCPCCGGLGKG